MANYKSHFISIYDIDIDSVRGKIAEKELKGMVDLENYVSMIIEQRLSGKKNRVFERKEKETTVISETLKILEIVKDEINKKTPPESIASRVLEKAKTPLESIASRLLEKEIEANTKYGDFISIRRGILIQSYLELEGEFIYLLAKIDHNAFISESNWQKQFGFPYERHVLKSCLIKFEGNPKIKEILVYDSNPKIARYWWDDFLELNEKRSDKDNTWISFYNIERIISKNLKEKSPTDHVNVLTRLENYYDSQKTFDFDEMKKNVFESYESQDPKIKMKSLVKQGENQIEKGKFDPIFPIDKKEISERYKFVIEVNDNIKLILTDFLDNLKHLITVEKDDTGDKFIKIKTTDKVFQMLSQHNGENE
ncbi:MAG: hypothetical protein JSV88_27605 [Candidatus Aminicenantes bacterium]|nr:MAG: hypothetical protein JSV88_27605 [Candidatus Aminicenantes bacterium]